MEQINLTPSERVRLMRYRSGLNQTDYAKRIGVSARKLMAWERGQMEPEQIHLQMDLVPNLGELARVLRWRAGLSIREAGALIGVSHVTCIAIERGQSTRAADLVKALKGYLDGPVFQEQLSPHCHPAADHQAVG